MTSFAVVKLLDEPVLPKVNCRKSIQVVGLGITHSKVFFFGGGEGGRYETFSYFCWGVGKFGGPFWGAPIFLEILSNTLHRSRLCFMSTP